MDKGIESVEDDLMWRLRAVDDASAWGSQLAWALEGLDGVVGSEKSLRAELSAGEEGAVLGRPFDLLRFLRGAGGDPDVDNEGECACLRSDDILVAS